MFKSKYLGKAIAIIMVAMLCLMAFPQVLMAAEPVAYALSGTIGSLDTLTGDDTPWEKEQTSGKIMIQPRDNAAGAKYSAYKLLDITNDSGVLKVSIPDDAQPFWKAYLGSGTNVTVGDIKNHIKSMTESEASSSMVEKFVSLDASSKPAVKASASADGSKATISTTFGFYIIQQTQAPNNGYIASAPVLACLPMQKTAGGTWLSSYTAIPKDDKIDVSKKVKAPGDANYIKETIAEIGDTLEYKIVADIAKYGSDITSGTITYNLVDTLPAGIKYKNGTAAVKFYKPSGEDTPSGSYVVGYNESTRKLTLDLGTDYAANLADYDTVEITYQATLESNAIVEGSGNVNSVVLTYTSAKDETKTYETNAKVYTHELDITKVDQDNSAIKLTDAVFQVYRTEAEADNPANAIKFIDISGTTGYDNGKHYRVATDDEITAGATTTTDIAVADDPKGEMKIYGLNDATYYFKEIVAPKGYNLPSDLFARSPAPTAAEKIEVAGDDTIYHDMAAQPEKITNDSGINLPVTGGMGTILFTAIGLLLMAGAVYFLFAKKKGSH